MSDTGRGTTPLDPKDTRIDFGAINDLEKCRYELLIAQRERDALRARLEQAEYKLHNASVCEIGAVNPNVASYCDHWEKRAEQAEGVVRGIEQLCARRPALSQNTLHEKVAYAIREAGRLHEENISIRRKLEQAERERDEACVHDHHSSGVIVHRAMWKQMNEQIAALRARETEAQKLITKTLQVIDDGTRPNGGIFRDDPYWWTAIREVQDAIRAWLDGGKEPCPHCGCIVGHEWTCASLPGQKHGAGKEEG